MTIQNKECEECGKTIPLMTFKKTRKVRNTRFYCNHCGTNETDRLRDKLLYGESK